MYRTHTGKCLVFYHTDSIVVSSYSLLKMATANTIIYIRSSAECQMLSLAFHKLAR